MFGDVRGESIERREKAEVSGECPFMVRLGRRRALDFFGSVCVEALWWCLLQASNDLGDDMSVCCG